MPTAFSSPTSSSSSDRKIAISGMNPMRAKLETHVVVGTLFGDHVAGRDVECGKELTTAPLMAMGVTLVAAGHHRQDPRGPVQGLDLGLVVDGERYGVDGQVHVQADDVTDLYDELEVGGDLGLVDRPCLAH